MWIFVPSEHIFWLNKMKECKPFIWKKTTVGGEHSWKRWQCYLIPPHGLLFSCRLIDKTDSLFSAGPMSSTDKWDLLFQQKGGPRWFPIVESSEHYPESIGEIKRGHQQIVIPHHCSVTGSNNEGPSVWFLYSCTATNLNRQNNKAKTWKLLLPPPILLSSQILPETGRLSDTINKRAGLSHQDGTHAPQYCSPEVFQLRKYRASHSTTVEPDSADDPPWKLADMKTAFNSIAEPAGGFSPRGHSMFGSLSTHKCLL